MDMPLDQNAGTDGFSDAVVRNLKPHPGNKLGCLQIGNPGTVTIITSIISHKPSFGRFLKMVVAQNPPKSDRSKGNQTGLGYLNFRKPSFLSL